MKKDIEIVITARWQAANLPKVTPTIKRDFSAAANPAMAAAAWATGQKLVRQAQQDAWQKANSEYWRNYWDDKQKGK
jgi:hypothetical protein